MTGTEGRVYTVTLPYPPQANHLYTIARGRKILSQAGRDYKETAGWAAKAAGVKPATGPVNVELMVYRPRKCGDLDNCIKAVLDSLKGITWMDDKQVVEIHAVRLDDKKNPRVEVRIEEV